MRTRSRPRSPGSSGDSLRSAGPWTLALRRLRRDRAAIAFAALFLLILLALLAAPLYASEVADTTPSENHLTDQTVVDGEPTDVISLDGIPIGPTWQSEYFLGADGNGRDLMVRLLYGARASLFVGAGAVLLSLLLAIPLGVAAGYRRGRTDAVDQPAVRPAVVVPGVAARRPAQHLAHAPRRGRGPGRDRVGLEADPDPRDRARLRAVRGAAAPRAGAHAPGAAVRGGRAGVRDAHVAADGVGAAAAPVGHAARARPRSCW